MRRIITTVLSIVSGLASLGSATVAMSDGDNGIGFALIHPPFFESYSCSEHWDGQLPYLGDSLGADCTIGRLIDEDERRWMREYQNSGLENNDWYGYGADVLAPCDCTVAKVHINSEENKPGILGKPPASSITFERPDGTLILLAHVKDTQVAKGDQVSAGDVVASVGNNGYSRQPHIHIGAWRVKEALQIRFDQKRMKPATDKQDLRLQQTIASVGYLWGYLKYHHPYLYEDCASWDGELIEVLKRIEATGGTLPIDAYVEEWVQRTQADREVEAVEPLARQQSNGIAVSQRQPKTHSFGIDMLSAVIAVRRDFVPEGQKCAYLGENTAGNALFDSEEPYDDMSPPDVFYRLLALVRFWNMVEYWFPYRDLIDEDWDSVLRDSVEDFRTAESSLAYQAALLRLVVRIDDTHAWLWAAGEALPPGGWAMSPVAVRSVEGRPFVWKRLPTEEVPGDLGVRPGDVILAVDSKPVPELMEEWRPYYGASNDSSFFRDAYQNLLRGAVDELTLTVERDGEPLDVIAPLVAMRDVDRMPTTTHERLGETFQVIDDDIAYLKLSTLTKEDLPRYVNEIIGKRGLIIDIRGYPNTFVVFSLGQHLVPDTTPFAKFTWPDAVQPGQFHWSYTLDIKPKEPTFKGPVAILVDERSQSQAEYTAMAFRASPNAVVFGSQSAGADGNVSRITLPGGQKTTFSGLGVFYPDGSPTQQIGIQPDYVVHPTLDGLRAGRDEVLEAALRYIANHGTTSEATAQDSPNEATLLKTLGLDKYEHVAFRDGDGKTISDAEFIDAMLAGRRFSVEKDAAISRAVLSLHSVGADESGTIPTAIAIEPGEIFPTDPLDHVIAASEQALLINFFFADCAPCIQEIPALNEFRLVHPNIAVAAVTFDDDDTAQEFVKSHGLQWPIVTDAADYIDSVGVSVYPTLALVSANGRLAGVKTGGVITISGGTIGSVDIADWVDSLLRPQEDGTPAR